MTAPTPPAQDVEALADVLMSRELCDSPGVYGRDYARAEARAVLSSDWLARHDREVAAKARAEALSVAGALLERVVEFWSERPSTEQNASSMRADLVDVLRAIEADAEHSRSRARADAIQEGRADG